MENRILNEDEIDNRFILDYSKAIKLIKEEVAKKLPDFKIVEINDKKETYYYYVIIKKDTIQIKIGGDRGSLLFEITIDQNQHYLDEDIAHKLRAASEKNISLIINIIAQEIKEM